MSACESPGRFEDDRDTTDGSASADVTAIWARRTSPLDCRFHSAMERAANYRANDQAVEPEQLDPRQGSAQPHSPSRANTRQNAGGHSALYLELAAVAQSGGRRGPAQRQCNAGAVFACGKQILREPHA